MFSSVENRPKMARLNRLQDTLENRRIHERRSKESREFSKEDLERWERDDNNRLRAAKGMGRGAVLGIIIWVAIISIIWVLS
jgi:hypothetical protein